jgi:hypothetical protein
MVLVHGNYEVVDRTDGAEVGLGRFAHIWTAAKRRVAARPQSWVRALRAGALRHRSRRTLDPRDLRNL